MNPSKKLIESLKEKKHRHEKGMFIVEGEKSVAELLASNMEIVEVYGVRPALNRHHHLLTKKHVKAFDLEPGEMRSLSTLEDNQDMLAIAKIPKTDERIPVNGVVLALDGIKDPGNMGAILRIADWYGIQHIVASEDTVDVWNSKVIAASMGSFTRVSVMYANLFRFIENNPLPAFAADMRGSNVHTFTFPESGILIIGSESHGISGNLDHLLKDKLTIPRFGKAESLNAAMATAIILDNWKKAN